VCVDHDYAEAHSPNPFPTGTERVAESLWDAVVSKTRELAAELDTGERPYPTNITTHRRQILEEIVESYTR
jgi:hypothetical protein